MLNRRWALLCAAFVACAPRTPAATPVATAEDSCERLAARAKEQAPVSEPRAYEVTGTERLYFHSAPDPKCRMPETFVAPKDQVVGYTEVDGFVSVMFVSPSGDTPQGWVPADRLRDVGSIRPAP